MVIYLGNEELFTHQHVMHYLERFIKELEVLVLDLIFPCKED